MEDKISRGVFTLLQTEGGGSMGWGARLKCSDKKALFYAP